MTPRAALFWRSVVAVISTVVCCVLIGASAAVTWRVLDSSHDDSVRQQAASVVELPPAASCDEAIAAMDGWLDDTALPWLVANHPELITDDSADAYEKFVEALPGDIKSEMLINTAAEVAACGEDRWDEYLDS